MICCTTLFIEFQNWLVNFDFYLTVYWFTSWTYQTFILGFQNNPFLSEPTGKLMVNTEADKFTMIYRTPLVNEVSVDSPQSPVISRPFSGRVSGAFQSRRYKACFGRSSKEPGIAWNFLKKIFSSFKCLTRPTCTSEFEFTSYLVYFVAEITSRMIKICL